MLDLTKHGVNNAKHVAQTGAQAGAYHDAKHGAHYGATRGRKPGGKECANHCAKPGANFGALNKAPKVILESTNILTLSAIEFRILNKFSA